VHHRLSILFWAAFPAGVMAQSVVLSSGSGTGVARGTVALAINIASTTPVAAVAWSFSYPASIAGLSVVPGDAAEGAQKSVVCAGTTCLAYGQNRTPIANGTLAVATFRLAPDASGPAIPIRIVGVSAATPAGASIPASGGSGLISVLPRRAIQPLESAQSAPARDRIRPVPGLIPMIADGGILNAASLTTDLEGAGLPRVAAGSLVSIFGANLGRTAASVRLTFNGAPAQLVFVASTQINAHVPLELLEPGAEATTASVVVSVEGRASTPKLVRIVRSSPGVFSVPAGTGNAILHSVADGTLAAPPQVSAICRCATRAIHPGEDAVLYATGLGPATPVVLIGGLMAHVTFFGQAPRYPAGLGVDQINIVVPATAPAGDHIPLQVQMGGRSSSSQVTIAVGAGH